MDRKPSFEKPELLAPAGDKERAKTAIRFGADAVYIGGKKYSLRARASNFSLSDIRETCAFAKAHGAHVHVTVNEIPHQEDLEGLADYLQKLQEAGVTAIIAASPAIMEMAHMHAPKLAIHCSTQFSVTNSEAAKFMVEHAFVDRIVLARECSLRDVEAIVRQCPAEIEAFIHGGMCVNYSGRCTLSNRMTLRDANRGGCAQSCRWSYRLFDAHTELSDGRAYFTMGSKDLSGGLTIGELMKANVRSLKIEGRMKTEFYVASVVSAYRHLIDELYENGGELPEERQRYHQVEIAMCASRETWTGFYPDTHDAGIIAHDKSNADVNHAFLGTVKAYDETEKTIQVETRNPFAVGERIEVLEPGKENRMFTIQTMFTQTGQKIQASRSPLALITLAVPFAIHQGSLLRRK